MQADISELNREAVRVRRRILQMANQCGGSAHIGGSLSMADMLVVLYKNYLNVDPSNPSSIDRDTFILSKGHCVLAFYAVLAECGFLSDEMLSTFQQDGSSLSAHPVMDLSLGIESSNGSLGQGISMAVGIALSNKLLGESNQVYTLIGDGEANEGAVWEAAMFASQHGLDNLTVLLDNNQMQSDGESETILSGAHLADRWRSFGFDVQHINGHRIMEICNAFEMRKPGRPHIIIGDTIKGYGVSFMENDNAWHHNRLSDKLYEEACKELADRYA